MLKLFTAAGTCALASHITLEESGAPYEITRLDFTREDQRKPDYLVVNPKGRVPALVTEQGVLTETPAILVYLAQLFPAAKLAPIDDAWALARVQSINSYLCSTVHVAHAHRSRGKRWADDDAVIEALKKKVGTNMIDCFALIEAGMLQGPWVMGDAFSVCDAYLFTVARWLEGDGVDIARFAKVAAHFKLMQARPAVQRVLAAYAA